MPIETGRTAASPLELSGESAQFRRFRLDCAALSAAGRGRAVNEDRMLFLAPGSPDAERAEAGFLFAVIDGGPEGGRGRRTANETATSILEILDDERRVTLRPDLLVLRLHDANDRVTRFIGGRAAVTAMWLWEPREGAEGFLAAWAHIGDTRLYHGGRSGWRQITRDHRKGRLLDRAIGGGPGMEIDTGTFTLRPGERLSLVSAGVWRGAEPRGTLAALPDPTAADAVRHVVGQARLNGSPDDTSAIVVAARRADLGPEPEH